MSRMDLFQYGIAQRIDGNVKQFLGGEVYHVGRTVVVGPSAGQIACYFGCSVFTTSAFEFTVVLRIWKAAVRPGNSTGTSVDLPAPGAFVTMPIESCASTPSKCSMKSCIVEQSTVPTCKMMETVIGPYKRTSLKITITKQIQFKQIQVLTQKNVKTNTKRNTTTDIDKHQQQFNTLISTRPNSTFITDTRITHTPRRILSNITHLKHSFQLSQILNKDVETHHDGNGQTSIMARRIPFKQIQVSSQTNGVATQKNITTGIAKLKAFNSNI